MKYRSEIDGLRALAVLPVIFFHAGMDTFAGGFVGVDVFFVISGYLITTIIFEQYKSGNFSVVDFYERRMRRILPALFFVMLCTIPFAWMLLLPTEMLEYSHSVAAVATMTSNFLFWSESGYFETAAELKPLLHTWSLAVEEQYYLLFPPLLFFCLRFKSWVVQLAMVSLLAISFAIAWWGSLNLPSAAFFLLPARGWELLVGAMLALGVERFWNDRCRTLVGWSWLNQALSSVGVALILYATLVYDDRTPFPGVYALAPVIGTALIILCGNRDTLVGRIFGLKPLVAIGLISYSAYLWHQPIFAFARYSNPQLAEGNLMLWLSAASLLLAWLSWRFVETPFRHREKWSRRKIFTLAALFSLVFIAFGIAGHFTKGFVQRFDDADRDLVRPKEEHNDYIWKRVHDRLLRDFPATDKHKVLVIGDSFSGDLVNALHEAGLADDMEISTYVIFTECGNLYLDRDFIDKVDPAKRNLCQEKGWFDNPQLRKLMAEADQIWMTSLWQQWVGELVPESVANLQRDFGDKVVIFGGKFFNGFSLTHMLAMSAEERLSYKMLMAEDVTARNQIFAATLPPNAYVDIAEFFCDAQHMCRQFTDDGYLIFFDGVHLTRKGAKYYGTRLAEHPVIKSRLAE